MVCVQHLPWLAKGKGIEEYTMSRLCLSAVLRSLMENYFLACRQNKALVPFSEDVDELNFRLKGANQRGRRLLGK
jgi:hypothetical protein